MNGRQQRSETARCRTARTGSAHRWAIGLALLAFGGVWASPDLGHDAKGWSPPQQQGSRGGGRGFGRRFRGRRGPVVGSSETTSEGTDGSAATNEPTIRQEDASPSSTATDETAAERFEKDRELFHALLSRHDEIRRTVENLEDGVRTLTETDDPELAELIREHVARMKSRVEEPAPIHLRDPLFAELFRHHDRIEMTVEATEKGVRVVERSDDPYVATLIRAHAAVVDAFVRVGQPEVRRNHEVPARPPTNPKE